MNQRWKTIRVSFDNWFMLNYLKRNKETLDNVVSRLISWYSDCFWDPEQDCWKEIESQIYPYGVGDWAEEGLEEPPEEPSKNMVLLIISENDQEKEL